MGLTTTRGHLAMDNLVAGGGVALMLPRCWDACRDTFFPSVRWEHQLGTGTWAKVTPDPCTRTCMGKDCAVLLTVLPSVSR